MDNQLAAVLRVADEEKLISLANKGVYKRAVKDAEGAEAEFTELENKTEVSVGGEKCVITVPLEESSCTCPSRTVCRHIITAILLLKKQLPYEEVSAEETVQHESIITEAEQSEPVEEIEAPAVEPPENETVVKLTENEIEKIRSSAEMCLGLICSILTHGLVRIPETAAEDFELAAVRCHAEKMAECERLMRNLGGRLADCAARRASFDSEFFTERLLETAEHLEHIMKDDITSDDLGSFRSVYENINGRLELLPVGQRTISGGEYEGEVFYFVNTAQDAEYRFLSFSDIHPVFYETRRKRLSKACPWGLGVPLSSMMKQRMTLDGAKVCEGRLSASKDTIVAANSAAVLDCPLIHSLMVTDFREIVLRLAEISSDSETDRLFFIYPKGMVHYGFDKNRQRLVITFEDSRGCKAECVVKYRAETRSFIEQLEKICKKIAEPSERVYTLLVSAYIENGRLFFFPIEIYDFIKPIGLHSFEMPRDMGSFAEEDAYAEEIGHHIESVSDMLTKILRTGLQSEHDCQALIDSSRSLGMNGLAELISEMAVSAENCRHSLTDGSRKVLDTMRKLKRYIIAAEERIGSVSALIGLEITKI